MFRSGRGTSWDSFEELYDFSGLKNQLSTLEKHLKEISLESNSTATSLELKLKAEGLFDKSLTLDLASDTVAGLMSSESFNQLKDLLSRVTSTEKEIEKINKVKDNHVFLTQEQYDALVTPEKDKIYMIYEQ